VKQLGYKDYNEHIR